MDHNNDYCYCYCYALVLWHFFCHKILLLYSIHYHRNSIIIQQLIFIMYKALATDAILVKDIWTLGQYDIYKMHSPLGLGIIFIDIHCPRAHVLTTK